MDITTKEPKYNARAGEVIAGNLARGGDGKFTRADGSAASGREVVNALTKKPKGGKGKKATTVSPAAQDALAQKVGLAKGDSAALAQFAKGGALDSATAQRLAGSGLVEIGKDGSVRFSDTGKSVTRALAKGDERGASDAMSRAKDRAAGKQDAEAKRAARDAERNARRAESQARRDSVQAQREQAKAGAASKRSAGELQTVNDRAEELSALNASDKNITDAERVKRLNQVDKLEKRLADAGGDSTAQAKLDALRKQLEQPASASAPAPVAPNIAGAMGQAPATEPAPKPRGSRSKYREHAELIDEHASGALSVFKSGDSWRWLGISSNAFKDRESEIVTQAALDADAERMTASGEYGPLRWWHVGSVDIANPLDFMSVKAGAGADIGSCDYSVTIGRMALEGGVIHSPEIAQELAAHPENWQMSRGFSHPVGEPQAGAYSQIKTFERSILPAGRAANPFTTVSATKEAPDMATIQEKMKALADKFFAGDEAKASEVFNVVAATDKEIADSGVAFKAQDTASDAPAETPADAAPVEAKDGAMPMDASAPAPADAVDTEDSGGDAGAGFIGDMTPEEFVSALVPALADAIAQAMAGAMAPTMQELSATKEQLATAQKEIAAIQTTKEKEVSTISAGVNKLEARVKELEGDAPGARGYRASEANPLSEAAVKAKGLTVEPQKMSEIERLGAWAAKL